MSRHPEPALNVFIGTDPDGMSLVGGWAYYRPTGRRSIETARASHHNVTIGPGAFNVDSPCYDENVMCKFIVHDTTRAKL